MKKFPTKCKKNLFRIFFAFHRRKMIFHSRVVVDLHKAFCDKLTVMKQREKEHPSLAP